MKKNLFLFLCICVCHMMATAQVTLTNPRTDQKLLAQFQNGKLGMFVHWMACHTPETGDSWSIGNGTPKSVADSITMLWNPVKFNAKEFVDTAVRLGCKYMVVISKHHDGFGIWDSKYSTFDLERVAFKRDILKELGEECHRQGLLYGIYYSIADIDYCGWERMPQAYQPFPTPKHGADDFIQFNRNQIKELIDNYSPDILWFDGFWLDPLWSAKEGKELYEYIKSLKSNSLSTRLAITKGTDGKETFISDGSSGDFFSLEAKTTDAPVFPWEACTSITYPVYAYEPEAPMLSKSDLLTMFHKTLCGNGNLLLNMGPTPSGELSKEQVARFSELTDWINENKEAVYNTKGGPFTLGDWGGSTYNKNHIYLHLQNKPKEIRIKTLNGYKVMSAIDLKTKQKIKTDQIDGHVIIYLPEFERGSEFPVIELTLNREFRFTQWMGF